MGRRKTKKPKPSGGGAKHSSGGAQGARATEAPASPPANADGPVDMAGACAANAGAAVDQPSPAGPATTHQPSGATAAEAKPRASPGKSDSGGRGANLNSNKALQRAQIQGELNNLEAQLAAVEDLQARMAAKLNSVDGNILSGTPDNAAQAPAPAPAAEKAPEKETKESQAPTSGKSKKNKRNKQADKAIKQEENHKEAQQIKSEKKENTTSKAGTKKTQSTKVEAKADAKDNGCAVESWEDIEQVWEGKVSEKKKAEAPKKPKGKPSNVPDTDDDSDDDPDLMARFAEMGDVMDLSEPPKSEKKEEVVEIKAPNKESPTPKPKPLDSDEDSDDDPDMMAKFAEMGDVMDLSQPTKKEGKVDIKPMQKAIKKPVSSDDSDDDPELMARFAEMGDIMDFTDTKKKVEEVDAKPTARASKQESPTPKPKPVDSDEDSDDDPELMARFAEMDEVMDLSEPEKKNVETKVKETEKEKAYDMNVSGKPSSELTLDEVKEIEGDKKILEDYPPLMGQEKEDLGKELDKTLASEIAGYLMADYSRMINLRVALDAECQTALITTTRRSRQTSTSEEHKKACQLFSYADAVKSSIKTGDDGDKPAEAKKQLIEETKTQEWLSEDPTLVHRYMKTEYEPCLRLWEAEEAERSYHEKVTPTPPKTEQPSNSGEGSDVVIAEAMAWDQHNMEMMSSCVEAEAKYKGKSKSPEPKSAVEEGTETQLGNIDKEVAKYLKEEYERTMSHKNAVSNEESIVSTVDSGDRHADAMRKAAMVEAAEMEVEYEGIERQFILQQQQRARAWRWVRSDTAPAHIDVPETVHEPVSDAEAEENADTQTTSVLTDMHGLVFQCKDNGSQTDRGTSAGGSDSALQEERAQRKAMQQYVSVLEKEVKDLREQLAQHRKMTNQLESSISDKKAEVTEAKLIAAEYKARCTNLEHSLDTAHSVVGTLESQVESAQRLTSGVDYMLEASKERERAAEAQSKIEDLETKLLISKAEVAQLLNKLAEQNPQVDVMPVVIHQQQMQKLEASRNELQMRVTQLEAELSQLRNVRDVWGSCQNPAAPQSTSLGMGFPVTGVDLPPVPSVPASCLASLGLGATPPDGSATLTSGLLSGLSDLQTKATPPVAPLAIQEDMESDDDVSWSSASEHLRDSRAAKTSASSARGPEHPKVSSSQISPQSLKSTSPLVGELSTTTPPHTAAAAASTCNTPAKPDCGAGNTAVDATKPGEATARKPPTLEPTSKPQLPNSSQTPAPAKSKGNKKRRSKKTQK